MKSVLKEKSAAADYGYPNIRLLIGGREIESESCSDVINPADGKTLGSCPVVSPAQLETALTHAQLAFEIWRKESPVRRSEVLLRAACWLRERIEEIATAITLDQGKPLTQAKGEVLRACELIEWDAGEARRLYGRVIPAESGLVHTAIRLPYGVVAAFSPWNYPISNAARKIAGAVASGCSIILKPAEETPAGGYYLVRAFIEAGVPDGLVNMVTGVPDLISKTLIADSRIRLIAFTGSTAVGKHLTSLAGQYMKPVLMELGGHAPVIVCNDADPIEVAQMAVIAKSRNAGQICTAPTRFYVHDAVYDDFANEFVKHASALRMGPGMGKETQLAPVANERRLDAIDRLVKDGVAKGASLLTGGVRPDRPGYFYPLTALGDTPDNALAMREEPFGPLALFARFNDLDDVIRRANALPFALAAYAFTDSSRNISLFSQELECGNLGINHFTPSWPETPFGGIKDSGIGREGGTEGLEQYTYVKCVSLRT